MAVKCGLYSNACIINPGECGDCRIRINRNNRLTAVSNGYPCAAHRDPFEKKPLFHFLPCTWIFSLAAGGCNLHCTNCQNREISRDSPLDIPAFKLEPDELPALVNQYECPSAAYTYTEPLVYYEYTLAYSRQVKEAGLKNVLVTADYLNPGPFKKLFIAPDEGENTFCSQCHILIVRRNGYTILESHMQNGRYAYCGEEVCGIWK